jgi:uncharacterized membrane protein
MIAETQNMAEDERGTSRLEAFSDGVLAVAITLLVLNIAVPEPNANEPLFKALGLQWPNYLGYVTSFLVIGIIWVNHHHLFRYLKRIDQGLLLLNILFLLFVGLIPFVTALVTRYLQLPDEHTAAIVYSVTLLLMSMAFAGLWWYAMAHPQLVDPRVDLDVMRHLFKRGLLGILFYLVAIVISLVSVTACLILYMLIAVFYALPVDRFLEKVRKRDEHLSPSKNATSGDQKED